MELKIFNGRKAFKGELYVLNQKNSSKFTYKFSFDFIFQLKEPMILAMSKLGFKDVLSPEEWNFLASYERVFAVITEATSLTEGDEYPSAAMYISLVVALNTVLMKEAESPECKERLLAYELKAAIEKRFTFVYSNDALVIATILDPRFKEEIFPEQFRGQCQPVIMKAMEEYKPPNIDLQTPEIPPIPALTSKYKKRINDCD